MRIVVIGLGVQGKKRMEVARSECVATVDPIQTSANFKQITDVPLESFDAALVCTPDEAKIDILKYLLKNGKHLLVEKPLLSSRSDLEMLQTLARENKAALYTAYNHRFEPHFIKMQELIRSGTLGKIYHCRMFYGNGTARDVRNSAWRDKNAGVLTDLGSHLIDTVLYWFGSADPFKIVRYHRFENKSPDHVIIHSEGTPAIDLEMSLLSWRNHFTCDLFAEKGSAHIESLCKWGPSKFIVRYRKLPSGRPDEETVTLVKSDPTWEAEYRYFKTLCTTAETNIANDLLINDALQKLAAEGEKR